MLCIGSVSISGWLFVKQLDRMPANLMSWKIVQAALVDPVHLLVCAEDLSGYQTMQLWQGAAALLC